MVKGWFDRRDGGTSDPRAGQFVQPVAKSSGSLYNAIVTTDEWKKILILVAITAAIIAVIFFAFYQRWGVNI